MSCVNEILKTVQSLVSIFVPLITLVYLIKGYHLAKSKWGREAPEFDAKEKERAAAAINKRIGYLDGLLSKHAQRREEISEETVRDAIKAGYTDEEILERADIQNRDLRDKNEEQRARMKAKLTEKILAVRKNQSQES